MESKTLQISAVIAVVLLLALFAVVLFAVTVERVPAEVPIERGYATKCYWQSGGAKIVCTSGGEIELQSGATLDVQSGATLSLSSFANLTATNGLTLTPTVTTYALDSAGAVTITLAASAIEGQLLYLIGDDANNIIVADTNLRSSTGAALTIGQYDVAGFIYQDSEWLELFLIADS